ncbi:MAG: hypothetical protein PVI23_15785 [Maricaulaceae bacterium]
MSISKDAFRKLSKLRIKEAMVLLSADQYAGAYYLAGYSIECALKSIVCNLFVAETLPDKSLVNNTYTHELAKLMTLSGLKPLLDARMDAEPPFAVNWAVVSAWSEESRYAFLDRVAAHTMVMAVSDSQTGVLPWIQSNW